MSKCVSDLSPQNLSPTEIFGNNSKQQKLSPQKLSPNKKSGNIQNNLKLCPWT